MKQLSKLQNIIFTIGALLMVAGAAMGMIVRGVAPYIYTIGALAFVNMQLQQRYEGSNFTISRLRRIMIISDMLLVLVGALMFADYGNPFGLDQIIYLTYIHNNWVVVLLLAAILQLYTVYRISSELEKEKQK